MKVKNKNGFISSSVMFSFFLVFILLSVLVLTSYMNYNILIKNLNGSILDGLNDHIASKYSGLKNLVRNGSLKENEDYWSLNKGARYIRQDSNNNEFLQVKPNTLGSFGQSFNDVSGNRVLYVAFNFNMYYPDDCTTCTFSVKLNDNKIDKFYYMDGVNSYKELNSNDLVSNNKSSKYQKWILFGSIYRTTSTINKIEFEANNLNYFEDNAGGTFGINNILLVDITNLYKDNNLANDENMIKYLLKELPYIDYDQRYSLPKI